MVKFYFSLISLLLLFTSAFSQKDVLIYPQPDSPVQLSNATASWRITKDDRGQEWKMLIVNFETKNVSSKTIRAYTIRQFEGDFKTDIGGTMFSYANSEIGIFQREQSKKENIGEFGFRPNEFPDIKLAVDFVEFTDGIIWGLDLAQSAEQSGGVKAGRKAGKEHLLKVKEQDGINGVVKLLDNQPVISPPQNQTQKWQRGFATGLKYFIFGLKRIYKEKGVEGLEAELQKADFITK